MSETRKFIWVDPEKEMATDDELYITAKHRKYKRVPRQFAQRCPHRVIWLVPVCEDCDFTFLDGEIPVHRNYPGSCKEMGGVDCDVDAQPYASIYVGPTE